MKIRLFVLLLCLMPLASAVADDVTISNLSEFQDFATSVNAGNDYQGKTVLLTADIDLGSTNWTPIGASAKTFQGIFDGQGHWISRLNVYVDGEVTGNQAGLFACIGASGVVRNVGIRSGVVSLKSTTGEGVSCFVGGIAGQNLGTIQSCANYATIQGHHAQTCVGGIAGTNSGQIADCYNLGRIFTSRTEYADGNSLGGIVGQTTGTVERVYSYAKVSSAARRGLVYGDKGSSTVKGAYAEGDLTGNKSEAGLGTTAWTFAEGRLPQLKCFTAPAFPIRTLGNDADNASTLTTYDGQTCDVTLTGRTLYRDDNWNTLTLPFALTDSKRANTLLADATVMALSGASFDDGTLKLTFTDVTYPNGIEAGRPYLVKWASGTPITNPVFTAVTLSNTTNNTAFSDVLTFTGNYAPVTLAANDRRSLYLGEDNTLYYPETDVTVGAFRAYFRLASALTAGDKEYEIRNFVLNFEDDEATQVEHPSFSTLNPSSFTLHPSSPWHTLDGRRLPGRPTAKGIYVKDGKRVVIL